MEKTKINAKDMRLLRLLDLNARATTSDLGREIRLSQEATHYRIRRLERLGAITGYSALLNIGRLGYTGYGVYAALSDVQEKTRIISALREHPHVYWVAEFGGRYDLAFAIMARSVVDFSRLLSRIAAGHPAIKDLTTAVRAELVQFPRAYLGPGPADSPRFEASLEQVETDELDRGILARLAENGREPILEIARQLGRPLSTVMQRVRRLEDSGVIQGYSTKIRCTAYGYESYQFFLRTKNLTDASRTKLRSYAEHHPNIAFFIETIGPWSVELIYEIESHQELQHHAIELRTAFPDIINEIDIMVLYDHYVKYNQYPLPA